MPLSIRDILHPIIALEREKDKESTVEDETLFLLLGLYIVLVKFYTEEVLWGFLPCGFPKENICVLLCSLMLLHLSFFKLSFVYGYDVMMLNFLDLV